MYFLQKSLAVLALGRLINGHYITKGVQIGIDPATGEVPARQNILELSKNQYQWYAKYPENSILKVFMM
jgi:hypothetical protein